MGLCVALCLSLVYEASAIDAYPSADSYISTVQAKKSFGNSANLHVNAKERSYLRFDFADLPEGITGDSIASATLKLYVNQVTKPGSFQVYSVDAAWTESKLAASNAPLAGMPLGSAASVLIARQFVSIDVTTLVRAWLDGTTPNNGIVLIGNADGMKASFDSKENKGTGHLPVISIGFVDLIAAANPGPEGAQGPQGLAGDVGPIGPVGPKGDTGPAGPVGAQGLSGGVGPIGPVGPQGVTGPEGPVGAQGTPGDVGPVGPVGPKGDAGQDGAMGTQGLSGGVGPMGPVGPKGDAGQEGPAGPMGQTGAMGPEGDAAPPSVFQNIVSVLDFGALGDGITDDTVSIQNAITALPVGSTLLFPKGRYKISNVTLKSGTNLHMEYGAIIDATLGLNGFIRTPTGTVDVSITGKGIFIGTNVAIGINSGGSVSIEATDLGGAYVNGTATIRVIAQRMSKGWIDNHSGVSDIRVTTCASLFVSGNATVYWRGAISGGGIAVAARDNATVEGWGDVSGSSDALNVSSPNAQITWHGNVRSSDCGVYAETGKITLYGSAKSTNRNYNLVGRGNGTCNAGGNITIYGSVSGSLPVVCGRGNTTIYGDVTDINAGSLPTWANQADMVPDFSTTNSAGTLWFCPGGTSANGAGGDLDTVGGAAVFKTEATGTLKIFGNVKSSAGPAIRIEGGTVDLTGDLETTKSSAPAILGGGGKVLFRSGNQLTAGVGAADAISLAASLVNPASSFTATALGTVISNKGAQLPYAAAVTPNSTYSLTKIDPINGPLTINAPLGSPIDGQALTIRYKQGATGGNVVTWDPAFDSSSHFGDTLSTQANARVELLFHWDASDQLWRHAYTTQSP